MFVFVGFDPYPFRSNQVETTLDKMRSLLATYLFRNEIEIWRMHGQNFAVHLAVPQVTQGLTLENRADHNHLLKRIATSTRDGRDQKLDLEAFDAALASPETGMSTQLS